LGEITEITFGRVSGVSIASCASSRASFNPSAEANKPRIPPTTPRQAPLTALAAVDDRVGVDVAPAQSGAAGRSEQDRLRFRVSLVGLGAGLAKLVFVELRMAEVHGWPSTLPSHWPRPRRLVPRFRCYV
jgi:hypothetical protein